jgi:NADH-quinone oxidoreductase subunit K
MGRGNVLLRPPLPPGEGRGEGLSVRRSGAWMTISINHYLVVSFLLFAIGLLGVLIRRNLLTVLMSIELMLNAVNLNLIAFSWRLSDLTGQIFSIFVIVVAAGEAAVGLALTISLFRQRKTLNVEDAHEMQG